MTNAELREWLESRNAAMFNLPHPRMVVIQVQSLRDPGDRVVVEHFDVESAIELAVMIYDLPMDARRHLAGKTAATC